MYGVDMMLAWGTDDATGEKIMQPKILEFNFNPDTFRACKYHPHFYDDCFGAMFLGDVAQSVIPL